MLIDKCIVHDNFFFFSGIDIIRQMISIKRAEQKMLHLLLLLPLLYLQPTSAASATNITLPHCPDSCGNITIPYPFGLVPGCFAKGFRLTCNNTYNPPKLFMGTGNTEISQISRNNIIMLGNISRDCYGEPLIHKQVSTDLTSTPFTFSYLRNKFTAIGCDTFSLIYWLDAANYAGCVSLCRNANSVINGSCGGIGCCQIAIPMGLKRFDAILRNFNNHRRTWSFSPCSYGFLTDSGEYEFDVMDFYRFRQRMTVPVVLDWSVGNKSCVEAERGENFLCGKKSKCLESDNGNGYRCSCIDGYQGNPYLSDGCQDINECEDPVNNPCADICTNTPGSYNCSCSPGSTGDGKKNGSGCTSRPKEFPLAKVVLGSGLGFSFLVLTTTLTYWVLKKRRILLHKDKFFKQNGGLLLQLQISSREGAAESAKIFTSEELSKATNKYSPTRVLGTGGSGTVYKGILPNKSLVAIKKSKLIETSQIEQFINEVVILSKVIHRNVVKIIGCCLETEVPLLVYEYVSNGTLFHHLHDSNRASSLSWKSRLRIAAESAGALAYLHSATTRPIIHRDVKSANILLDENYTAKVSDFGASRLIPIGKAELATLVQGTLGYLDPEYFQSGLLTEKSDVYSFGVVLVELLTGKRPISSLRSQEEKLLSNHFILSMERNQLFDILEARVVSEGERSQLQEIAELAKRCLRLTGEERPTMKEVVEELEKARSKKHPWDEGVVEEGGELLLDEMPLMSQRANGSWTEQTFDSYNTGR